MAEGRRRKDYGVWIALGVLALLGVWLWFDLRRPTHEPGENPKVADLVGIAPAEVSRIEMQSPGKDVTIVRAGAGWNIEQPIKSAADSDEVKRILDGFLDHTTDFVLQNPGRDLARFQLQQASAHVTFTSNHGIRRTLDIGGQDPSKTNVYVLDGHDHQVFLVSSSDADMVRTKTAGDLRDKSLLSIPQDQVASIRIQRKAGTLEVQRTGDQWNLAQPWKAPADSSTVDSMTSTLSSLKAGRFVDNPSANLATYGLKPPKVTVTVTDKAGKQTVLELGNKEPGKTTIYAVRGSHPTEVVTVSDATLGTFDKAPLDLRSRKMADFQNDDVQRLAVTGPAGSWEAQKTGEDWKFVRPLGGQKADSMKMGDVLFAISGPANKVAAENPPSFAPYGLDRPALTATVTLKAGKKELFVGKKTPKGDYYARGSDAMDAVFEITSSTFTSLNKKPDSLK